MFWRPTVRKRKNWKRWEQLSKVCSQVLLKFLYMWRSGRPDILWSAHKLAGAVAKRTRACDRRLARSMSYIQHTSDYRQYSHVRNTAQHCRVGLLQDSDLAGDLEDSKSTSGRILCIFRSRTFGRISWMCKEQTSTVPLNLRLFLYMQCDGRFTCSWSLGFGCWSKHMFLRINPKHEATCCAINIVKNIPTQEQRNSSTSQ